MDSVWVVIGVREGEIYSDPGADELVSIHSTQDKALAAAVEEKKTRPHRYDYFEVEERPVL